MNSLEEMTGQKAGLVIYGYNSLRKSEEAEAIICDWSGVRGLPTVVAGSILGYGEELSVYQEFAVDNVGAVLEESRARVVLAPNDDLLSLDGLSGRGFEVRDDDDFVTVIAPVGWD
jgi:hypothetical protein